MIGFAAPLFAALALTAGFIWFLHSRREYRRVVPSLMLWRQLQTHAGLKSRARLIPPITLPLVLQLLTVALLTAALTQPFWGDRNIPDHLVVVFDTGAAMGARDGEATLIETARESLIADFGGSGQLAPQRLSVVTSGPQPAYAAARWSWRDGLLEEALADARPTDGTNDWRETARLVSSLVRDGETTEVLVIGASAAPESFTTAFADATISQRVLAVAGQDASLSGQLMLSDPEAGLWTLQGEAILHDDRESLTVTVQYSADMTRTPLDWTTIELERNEEGNSIAFSQELELPGAGIVTAFIESDATPRDNRLRFVAEASTQTLDILYVGEGDQPLLRALNAVEGVRIFQDTQLSAAADEYGLVILDGVAADALPQTNVIVIGGSGEDLADPDPDFWDTGHPLSRDIDWSTLSISAAQGLERRADETVLLAADGQALITARATPDGRVLRIGLDPRAGNWPQTTGFPVLASNLIDWMGLNPGTLLPASCTVGLPCALDARLLGQPIVNLEAPRPNADRVPEGEFIPSEVGLFRVGQGALTRLIAVNPAPLTAPADAAPLQSAPGLPPELAWWLIGAAFAALAVEGLITAQRKRWLPRLSVLRILSLVLLAAALFNLPLPWPEQRTDLVLVVPEADAIAFANGGGLGRPAIGALASGPQARVLADFGAAAPAGADIFRVTHTRDTLGLAAAMIPPGREGRIVLAGDTAREPMADRLLAERGIVVDYLQAPDPGANELYVGRLDMPEQVLSGEAVPLTALVHSRGVQTVGMEIVAGGQPVASQDIELAAGQNRIEAVLPQASAGGDLIELRLAGNDAFPQNDARGQVLSTAPVRPIAIIAADPAHGRAFAGLLADQGLETEVFEPGRAPYYLKDWLGFGGIVLVNTPALALTTLQQSLIETSVAQYGTGLVILGGPNSFGPGGYFGTALETLSPLSSRVPQDAPEVVMVFVLDRSGSMQQPVGEGNRLDIAKTATVAATDLLNPQSQVGIIAFDAEARTLLPLTRLADAPGAVQQALQGFDPGGGTSIYPGLVEALEMMRGLEAPAKHLVVMTDGLSQPGDFPGIVGQLTAEGITVSAVAIGQGADTNVARTIAELGGGSAHITSDFAALPSILSQEAMLLASPIEEGVTQPVWQNRSASFLSALPEQLPSLTGFVGTTAKPDAELVATAPNAEGEDMPVMAHWRYGNGMVMALATDATGPWSEAWQSLPQYGALWSDILAQFQPTTPRPGLTLSTQGNGDYLDLRVTALDTDGSPLTGRTLTAMVTAPDAETGEPMALTEILPGQYQGRRVLDATGRYQLTVDRGDEAEPVETAYYHSYDPRYDFSRSGGAAALAQATGGRAIAPEEIETLGAGLALGLRHQWPIWVLVAFTLFLLDLTLRYRGFSTRRKAGSGSTEPDALRQGGPI